MSLSLWLEINAFLALFFGSVLIFWPRQMMSQSGIRLDDMALNYARSLGGAVLGFALINWGAHNFTHYDVVWWIVGANILMQLVTGVMDWRAYKNSPPGWFSVVFHFVIAAVFVYYLLFTR